jgi:hypothetical protein
MRTTFFPLTCALLSLFASIADGPVLFAAGGQLTLSVREESTDQPTIARIEIRRADAPGKRIPIRLTVPAGNGVVLDRKLEISLPDALYRFQVIRGPEYRIVSGNFTLEPTSLDAKTITLPRMTNMLAAGWTSGDCCVSASPYSLPLRMAAEDLHVAGVLGHQDAKPIPRRDPGDPIENDPSWIREDLIHHHGIVVYGLSESLDRSQLPVEWMADLQDNATTKVAVENPFAWPLPVWLATEQVDGLFVMGDWLRLDQKVNRPKAGRGPIGPSFAGGIELGRWAERIYWNMLEAGLRIAPLAGSGNDSGSTPVGYNRLYVATASNADTKSAANVSDSDQWWQAAWSGHSVATNGPMLRPTLAGKIPGHIFRASAGEELTLEPELTLSVRDKVDYLEVMHNGQVHYSARLDEFAKAGGRIPPLQVSASGWVTIRVMTLYEDHFRAATSAPWYIEFDGRRRVTPEAVKFFQDWLAEYEQRLKQLPKAEIKRHAPYVRRARRFWNERTP